jgi:hypothetical protein
MLAELLTSEFGVAASLPGQYQVAGGGNAGANRGAV